MKRLHLIIGLFVVVTFLLTGQLMEAHNPRMDELEEGTRMMYRSRHIYIVLAGLLNLGIGLYFNYRREGWRKALQVVGSVLIMLGPLLSIGAFFYEPLLKGLQRPLTLPAIVALSVGVICHLISGMGLGKQLSS